MTRVFRRPIAGIVFFILSLGGVHENWAAAPEPQVRVLLFENKPDFLLTVKGGYKILDFVGRKPLSVSKGLYAVRVRAKAEGLFVAGVRFPESIEIIPDKPLDIYVNNVPFYGSMVVHRRDTQSLSVVNRIGLEEYLYGVLAHEVGAWWPIESLKAQAVAARSYAMYQLKTRKDRLFDVYNDQASQMYRGAASDRSKNSKAVDETRGQVLVYAGQILPAFYHATCGGMTRDASELWKLDLAPLKGGVACRACWFSPHFAWETRLSGKEIESILNEHEVRVSGLEGLEVASRTPTERVETLRVRGLGQEQILSAKNFRLWVGPTVIRSEVFDIESQRGKWVFKGRGWGHGVGLCQWGALGMAIARKDYESILDFYYPGAVIRDLASL